ncbi:hypothetical protein ACSFA7_33230 [Variovorax sp. LT1R20]|uniref:hypothetical protein n=1 Tax=Variovorax sp. LT1R20 TaxID=3443729 RepID=UPI003F45BEB0
MFDITSDDISQLNDIDLRELVGRLCEAELIDHRLSPAAVTWGGNQTAADGGLDVRVMLPPGAQVEGFIPRRSTGFQVKLPDMPRGAILAEMRPTGAVRPVIQELAGEAGAYIVVSSKGSTADSALRSRRGAMRDALEGLADADQLHTDFYDRTRLATWVRRYPGLVTWVKARAGRALVGWRPYGPWSGAAEGVDAEYLLDDKLRLHLGKHRDAPAQSVAHVFDELRDELAQPGKIVRLVGLSGVGKTRLVQALFDARIGSRPLPPSLAVYTNLSDNPDPQPTGLASDLLANRTRAILIIDNCPPDLHRRLTELCSAQTSTVSVLTVEYDVRDDQPEGTQVVTLESSSSELIEMLIRRRYPHLSPVDARTIAEASGGNARIAVALAETVERSDTVAGLSNDELFQRLFRQRHDPDNALLRAAQVCALVYSFQGEALERDQAELTHLAALAGQAVTETYRHVGELLRRDLVQPRGIWRAVLPHAIANRLAARALEDTPYELINQQLVAGGTDRLARSFSRRLSFLHDHSVAASISARWLSPGGLLGDVAALNDLGRAMFENIAPVAPEAALTALERVNNDQPDVATAAWRQHLSLLRSLAYDPLLFERSAHVLARASTQDTKNEDAKKASNTFLSLFTIYLSGTHASIEQRLNVIEQLLSSGEPKARALGLAALSKVLMSGHFSSAHKFSFGARSRDYGYRPSSDDEIRKWYGSAVAFIERLSMVRSELVPDLRDLLAKNFRRLWILVNKQNEFEELFLRFAANGFWREGWMACLRTMKLDRDRLTSVAASRLASLEAQLRPSTLPERVRALVLGTPSDFWLDLDSTDGDGDPMSAIKRSEAMARELGTAVAVDGVVLAELLPALLSGGYGTWAFGRGLADASADARLTWETLVRGLELIASEQRDIQVLRGFLAQLWEQDQALAQHFLDTALHQPCLLDFLPLLHSAVQLDERGSERLERALRELQAPVWTYRHLASGRTTEHVAGTVLRALLLCIANQPEGFDVALEILYMRLHLDDSAQRAHEPELLEAGRELLQRVTFKGRGQNEDHRLAGIVKACVTGPDADRVAAEIAVRLRRAVAAYETSSFDNEDLLKVLLELQPTPVLDALFDDDEENQLTGISVFERLDSLEGSPADAISSDALIAWCERDRERHYLLAASIITFAHRPEANAPLGWSEQARALLARAPEPASVLARLIERFSPMSWSGSRAALMEANAELLNHLEPNIASRLERFVAQAKAQIAREVARERLSETEYDRARDERFE